MAGSDRRAAAAARHRLLPEGRVAGPMPWIIAIMMFLTVLSAATGLGLGAAVKAMGADLAGRATVQIVEADAQQRDRLSASVSGALRKVATVRAVNPVAASTLADQIRPWLGQDAASGDLPIPALIDIELTPVRPMRRSSVFAASSARYRPKSGSSPMPPSSRRSRACCPRSAGWRRGSCC